MRNAFIRLRLCHHGLHPHLFNLHRRLAFGLLDLDVRLRRRSNGLRLDNVRIGRRWLLGLHLRVLRQPRDSVFQHSFQFQPDREPAHAEHQHLAQRRDHDRRQVWRDHQRLFDERTHRRQELDAPLFLLDLIGLDRGFVLDLNAEIPKPVVA